MDFSPESLLEMAKNVVDNNDFVNAIVLLKRGIESIKDRKGEDAKLNLIMLHMELIQVLEKSKLYNEALGLCNEVFDRYPEGQHLLDLLELKGRIQFSLGNYTAAKKDVGDAYEMACRGNYDGIIKNRLWNVLASINVFEQQIRCRYDFYEILQVDRQDSEEKITEALREFSNNPNSVNPRCDDEISSAGWVLLNKDKRPDYDNKNFSIEFTDYFEHPEFYRCRPF